MNIANAVFCSNKKYSFCSSLDNLAFATVCGMEETRRKRLLELIKKFGTQAKLAELIDVTPGYITQLKRGERPINEKTAEKFEKSLNLPHGWMSDDSLSDREIVAKHGITPSEHDRRHDINAVKGGLSPEYLPRRVPLISSTTAGHWAEVVDNFQPGDAERWIEVPASMGDHAFALRILGDSMEPTIRDGWIVVVDPDYPADHGKIVVVRQNSDTEATCKRLIYDGNKPYLRPDNDRYPIMEMREDAVICGVVRRAQVDFD